MWCRQGWQLITSSARFLNKEAASSVSRARQKFQALEKNILVKTMKSGNSLITVIINKRNDPGMLPSILTVKA